PPELADQKGGEIGCGYRIGIGWLPVISYRLLVIGLSVSRYLLSGICYQGPELRQQRTDN
ncbi:MAG: hypothetical protein ACLFMQ_06680, partial [Desulfohalobiaceae bacterium]